MNHGSERGTITIVGKKVSLITTEDTIDLGLFKKTKMQKINLDHSLQIIL